MQQTTLRADLQQALHLPDSVTFDNATACSAHLKQEVDTSNATGADIAIDLANIQNFDSSVLAVLLQCRRDVAAQGKALAVVNMPERLQELAKLYGVLALFS